MDDSKKEDRFVCEVCGEDGKDFRGLVQHMQVVTTSGRWPCLHYSKFNTIQDFRTHLKAKNRKNTRDVQRQLSADDVLEQFQSKVKYGPMFACAACHTHHQYGHVSRIDTIPALRALQDRRRFLGTTLPPHLFVQLDNMWVCRSCKFAISSNTLPPLASVNNLHGNWGQQHSLYTQEEVDLLSLTHVFRVVHNLQCGVARLGTTTLLDLYVPLQDIADAEATSQAERPPEEVLLQLHIRPPGERPEVDKRRFKQAVQTLLDKSARYRPRRDDVKQDIVEFWDDILNKLPFVEEDWDSLTNEVTVQEEESHLTRTSGLRVKTIHSVVLPNSAHELSNGQRKIPQMKNFDVKIGGALDDPEETACMEFEREVKLSNARWMQQRMSHVSRKGPCVRPGFIFGVLLRDIVARLTRSDKLPLKQCNPNENKDNNTSFDNNELEEDVLLEAEEQKAYLQSMMPGTIKYLQLKREELEACAMWYGPPTVFVTTTLNGTTEDVIACFTSHSREEGNDFQVWHESDEATMLQLRPGKSSPVTTSGKYFVHSKSVTRYDNCPFHNNCRRDTLEEAKTRY